MAPEHIRVCGDDVSSRQHITSVRLQILIPVLHPGRGLRLGDTVPLDEEEFGLAGQHGARISGEETSDTVQRQTCAVRVGTQQVIRRTTANDATDKAVTFKVLPLSDYPSESREGLLNTQPLVEEHVEVECPECLFQHI